jgi:hypothetical protein
MDPLYYYAIGLLILVCLCFIYSSMMLASTIAFYTYCVFYVNEEEKKIMINVLAGQRSDFPYIIIATHLVNETKKFYIPRLLRMYLLFPYLSLYLYSNNYSSFYIMIAYFLHILIGNKLIDWYMNINKKQHEIEYENKFNELLIKYNLIKTNQIFSR